MKIKLSSALLLSSLSLTACAFTPAERAEQVKANEQILAELGLPLPKSGIQIVPRSQLGLPEAFLKQGLAEIKQRESLGYAEKVDPYIAELLGMKSTAAHDIKLYASNQNASSTHLRKSVQDLKLAFEFPGTEVKGKLRYVPGVQTLGAAPQGSFDPEKGWSGALNFFAYRNLGVCAYGVMNVEASGTAAMLAAEDVTYEVNDKPTLIKVDGKRSYGFLYKVEWFDAVNFHELQCATQNYSDEIKGAVIQLAKNLDKQ